MAVPGSSENPILIIEEDEIYIDIIAETIIDSLNDGTRDDISAVQRWASNEHTIPQRQFDIPTVASFGGALREKCYGLQLERGNHMEDDALRYGQHLDGHGPIHRRSMITLQPSISVEPPSGQQLRSLGITSVLNSRADATGVGRTSTATTDARPTRGQPQQGNRSLQPQLPFAMDLESGSISQAAKREANRYAARRSRMRKQARPIGGGEGH